MGEAKGFWRARCLSFALAAMGLLGIAVTPARAGAHTWVVNEIFSNASGTIQFVELREANGGPNETGVGGQNLFSNSRTYDIPNNVVAPTTFKTLLFATPAFAALPGAPTPDFIFPVVQVPFLSVTGDNIRYGSYDSLMFSVGQLPTDGLRSLNRNLTTGIDTATNYAGQTWLPPGVPDGSAGSAPLRVVKNDPAGMSLTISWETGKCPGANNHQLIYGGALQLPAAPGGSFGLTGSVCGLGAGSSFVWNPAPVASRLIWILIVVKDAQNREGSWGDDGAGAERIGPGPGGSSGLCGVTARSLVHACGH